MPPTPDFRLLFQAAPNLYLVLTTSFKIVAVSDAYLRATLTERDQILSRDLFEVFPDNPEDPKASGVHNLRSSLERVLQFKSPDTMAVQKYDIRKPDAEGGGFEERYWSPQNSPVLGPGGEIAYIIHSVEDVTEIVRLKQQGFNQENLVAELRTEEKFRKAFNVNPEPIFISTFSEGRYIDVNESFLRATGYRREEVIGRTAAELGLCNRPEERARLAEILEKHQSARDVEISYRTKSGQQRTGLESAEIIDLAGQKCIFSIFKDVTDHKVLEEQLRQAAKMEAVGQLSGGIAHDFNNLLGVIIGYCEMLEEQIPPRSPLRKDCDQIKKAGERAAALTRQLLAFSRQQVLDPKILDLNATARDLEKMLRRLIGEHIDLMTSLDPVLGSVKADRGQIEQVIMNLVVNARDAMPEGGRLTIETANVELDEGFDSRHPQARAGSYVVLSVSDTGMGMDAQTQARIFDPFFTTKELGKGTGLGLSTVYGVVSQSGGHIGVYSELGHGTTFKIYLPRVGDDTSAERKSSAVPEVLRGAGTILLVEDEEPLRVLTRRLLIEHGYSVLDAGHPDQALQIARQHSGPIDMLLTDVVMPGMNGRVLVEKLAAIRPLPRIIYMSGYSGFTHGDLFDSEANFLSKPFSRDTLFRKLQEVMARDVALKGK
jgi:two-component system cell cycle sensor histidine kinase/response regulator CckA